MLGRIARVLFLMLLAVTTIVSVSTLMGVYYYKAPGSLQNEVTIVLKRGTPFKTTVKTLYQHNIIDHPSLFALVALATQKSQKIKAGEYRFEPHSSFYDVLEKLTSGNTIIRKVTVPEGISTVQIIRILSQTEGLYGTITVPFKEGDLLPETYHFSYGDSRDDIIKRMKHDMRKTLASLWEKRHPNLPFSTPEEAVVLASIVEKETGIAEERPRIAAVFINRLRKKMPLQSDPTVIYAITKGKEELTRPLTYTDLKFPSPYNTYMVQGLPPHPIAYPGKAAIEAVLTPLSSKELYFVADGKGGHNFAETLKEHNRNVTLFRNKVKSISTAQ